MKDSPPGHGTHRLLRHDLTIAWNIVRATFTRWHDRLLGGFILAAVFAGARRWIADVPESAAVWLALVAGISAGLAAGGLVNARLAYQESDGLLAADALQSSKRQRYLAAGLGLGLLLLIVVMAIVRPPLLVVSVPGYVGGALVAQITRGMGAWGQVADTARPNWAIQAWSRRPITGIAAAALLILFLLPVRSLTMNIQMALAGSGTILLAMMLSRVDDDTVRFMSIAGHRSVGIFTHHAKSLASFIAAAVSGTWAMMGPQVAAIVAAASGVMLLLFAFRILAYRLHKRRGADLLVSVLVGLFVLVAYALPPALPVIAIAMLWQLHRRGQQRTWLVR